MNSLTTDSTGAQPQIIPETSSPVRNKGETIHPNPMTSSLVTAAPISSPVTSLNSRDIFADIEKVTTGFVTVPQSPGEGPQYCPYTDTPPPKKTCQGLESFISSLSPSQSKCGSSGSVKPQIVSTDDGHLWLYEGQHYPLKKIGQGKFHFVYVFTGKEPLKLITKVGDVQIEQPDELVLKKPTSDNYHTKKKQKSTALYTPQDQHDLDAYEALKQKINLPEVIASPATLTNSKRQSLSGIWILEKMTSIEDLLLEISQATSIKTVTYEAKKLLDWVKEKIQAHVQHALNKQMELFPDFKPANVMKNRDGEFGLCDFDKPKPAKGKDWLWDLQSHINEWAGGKKTGTEWTGINPTIYSYLVDFKAKDTQTLGQMIQEARG